MKKKPLIIKRIFFIILFIVLLPVLCIVGLVKGIIKLHKKRKFNSTNYDKQMFLADADIERVDIMEGYEFEVFLRRMFFYLGFDAKETQKSKDYGADLVLKKDGKIYIVQAKRYKKSVGLGAVQEVISAKNHYGATEAICITNSRFTPEAETLAKENQVELIERAELVEILSKLKVELAGKEDSTTPANSFNDLYKFRI